MQPDHRARYTFGFALLAALLAALILWNLNTGSLHLSPAEVMNISQQVLKDRFDPFRKAVEVLAAARVGTEK